MVIPTGQHKALAVRVGLFKVGARHVRGAIATLATLPAPGLQIIRFIDKGDADAIRGLHGKFLSKHKKAFASRGIRVEDHDGVVRI